MLAYPYSITKAQSVELHIGCSRPNVGSRVKRRHRWFGENMNLGLQTMLHVISLRLPREPMEEP